MARTRCGIDEGARFRVGGRVGEVVALGVVRGEVRGRGLDHVVDVDGVEAGGVDECFYGDGFGFFRGRGGGLSGRCPDFPSAPSRVEGLDASYGRVEGTIATKLFEGTL